MAKWATIDGNGLATAFYEDTITSPPVGAIKITEDIWKTWVLNQNIWAWNGTALVSYTPPPSSAQYRNNLSVEFKVTSALSGTYLATSAVMTEINMIENYVNKNGAFPPKNAATLDWPDVEGKMHTFPNIETFKAWSTAMLDHVIGAKLTAESAAPTTITLDL